MCRGLLIVLEGCDGAGKTSLGKRLVEELNARNISSHYLSFPDRGSKLGKFLDNYLRGETKLSDRAAHLLFSADRWEKVSEMKKQIESGISLVVDRYAYSGTAFSSAKGLSLEWCKNSDQGLPKPDLVCFLSVTPEEALLRGDFGTERFENAAFQSKVNSSYKFLMEDTWKIIRTDGRAEDEVYKELFCQVNSKFKEEKTDMGLLWM